MHYKMKNFSDTLKCINKDILRIFLPFRLQKSSFLQMWIKKKKQLRYFSLQDQGEFDWSPTIQSAISGSFYWCYILSQVVGGVLTQYFGTKAVFGGSQLITAICSLLMPSAAGIHYGFMIALRSIQGVASVSTFHIKKEEYIINRHQRNFIHVYCTLSKRVHHTCV